MNNRCIITAEKIVEKTMIIDLGTTICASHFANNIEVDSSL